MELKNRIERARAREEVLTLEEATRFFRISKPTLLGALQHGELPAYKIGRQWRIYEPLHSNNLKKLWRFFREQERGSLRALFFVSKNGEEERKSSF